MNNCDASDSPYHVLLIEDDLVDVELVTRYLGQSRNPRFVVESAQYFQQAVELLAVGTFDAVLLDLNLPDSCGLDSIDLVMSAWESGPIIVLTGVEEDCLGVDAMRHGAQDYLVKEGLSASLLTRSIRYAVERHYLISYLDSMKKANEQLLPEFCEELRSPLSEMLAAASDLCGEFASSQADVDVHMKTITDRGTQMVELMNHACPRPATEAVV